MKRPNSVLSLACAFLAIGLTSGNDVGAQGKHQYISIGTGGPMGVYSVAGNAICSAVNAEAKKKAALGAKVTLLCSAPPTGGSIYNLRKVAARALNFGITQSDWQHVAYTGAEPQTIRPIKALRSLFSLHAEPFHLVVARESGIRDFKGLKGRKVNVGTPGSGQRATLEVLLQSHGMTLDDFSMVGELTADEQAGALCAGKIDAYATVVGLSSPVVGAATGGCGAIILDMNTEVEKRLVKDYPFYAFATIPQGTYATTDEELATFGVLATVVTRAEIADDIVYEVVRAVMSGIDAFRKEHPAFAGVDPQRMIKDGLSAPLHPGAIRYYREKGWM